MNDSRRRKSWGHSGVSDFDVGNPFILPCFGAVCFAVRSSSPLRRSCAEDSSAGRRCGPQHDEFLAICPVTRPPVEARLDHRTTQSTKTKSAQFEVALALSKFYQIFQVLLPGFTRIHQGCVLGPRKVMGSDA